MTTTTLNSLADKPSELIDQALDDLALCEVDPKYRVDMAWWHMVSEVGDPTCVCLAGVIIAKRLNADVLVDHRPSMFDWSTEQKLRAINLFREGYVREGLHRMGYDAHDLSICPDDEASIDIPQYDIEPVAFKRVLRAVAQRLRSRNL